MDIQESGEMYLESLLILSKEKNTVRAIDIAEFMNFSKASVSRALSKLKEGRFILVDGDGYIAFTEKGRAIAESIYERHTLLTEYFIRIGVDEKTASADACKIEHVISEETFSAIKKHAAEFAKKK
ncbi:MAG: metal-dependent transcriptional regulator [Lachnospiraceae bacterium]|nr:metal-dependent transcriptional regulator [Lachnospiraceae bacterium]